MDKIKRLFANKDIQYVDKASDVERHKECKYYSSKDGFCTFFTHVYERGENKTIETDGLMSVLLFSSGALFSLNGSDEILKEHEPFMLFLDKNTKINIKFYNKCRLCQFSFDKPSKLCESYSITRLKPYLPTSKEIKTLALITPIKMALDSMVHYYENGLYCSLVTENKLKEMFFIISAYYSEKDLGHFLAPLLGQEVDFKEFVTTNYSKVHIVQELAEKRNMSLRVFNKMFKDTFKMPPYKWILIQKGKQIEKKLSQKNIPLSSIIEEFNFSSPSHFTVYCRKQFGRTPTQMRKYLIEKAEKKKKEE